MIDDKNFYQNYAKISGCIEPLFWHWQIRHHLATRKPFLPKKMAQILIFFNVKTLIANAIADGFFRLKKSGNGLNASDKDKSSIHLANLSPYQTY